MYRRKPWPRAAENKISSSCVRCRQLTLLLVAGCAGQPGSSRLPGSEARTELGASRRQPNSVASDEMDQLAQQYAEARPIRTLSGKATYYSNSLAGNKMASGERYDPKRAQAAHRTLPFGTVVRVTRVATNDSVIVRITDRGPFGGQGRIIDLSYAAAERLRLIRVGVAEVRVEVLQLAPSGR